MKKNILHTLIFFSLTIVMLLSFALSVNAQTTNTTAPLSNEVQNVLKMQQDPNYKLTADANNQLYINDKPVSYKSTAYGQNHATMLFDGADNNYAMNLSQNADGSLYIKNTQPYQTQDQQKKAEEAASKQCGVINLFSWACISLLLKNLGYALLLLCGWILAQASALLNYSVNITVVQMAANVSNIDAINTAWLALRDVANMTFIFILLYIAIATILQLSNFGTKQLLARLAIAIVLINFSLFITKVIIDSSNILAKEFYSATGAQTANGTPDISGSFQSVYNLQSIFIPSKDQIEKAKASGSNKFAFLENENAFVIATMGSIFLLITSFVFFIAAILFATRFVVLVMVMILSPLAFVSMVLPQTRSFTSKWWSALFSQAFFAPIFFMLIWITLLIVTSDSFKTAMAMKNNGGFINALSNPSGSGSMGIILNFIVVSAFLIASLVISRSLASKGGSAVSTFVGKAQAYAGGAVLGGAGWAGRQTFGRGAEMLSDSDFARSLAGSKAGRLALQGLSKVGKSSFDVRATGVGGSMGVGAAGGRGGFAAELKKQTEAKTQMHGMVSSQTTAETLAAAAEQSKIGNMKELEGTLNKEKSNLRAAAAISSNPMMSNSRREAANREAQEAKRKIAETEKKMEISKAAITKKMAIEQKARDRGNKMKAGLEKSILSKMTGGALGKSDKMALAKIVKSKSNKDKIFEAAMSEMKEQTKSGEGVQEEKPKPPTPKPPTASV
ncbi:MAG: hypothetical protein WCW87_00530 [Candidatus Paceibacterota bacterium]